MVRDVTTRRLDCGTGTVDRISNLPSSLITLILKCLPIHDVAKTSILSKTWRGIWVMHPHLVFDEAFFTHCVSEKEKNLKKETKVFIVTRIISNILLLHTGPVLTFHLSVPRYLPLYQYPDTGFWISNISNNGVKNLKIINKQPTVYKMPSYIFSCLELNTLNISNCILNPPLRFGGFCSLIVLKLVNVKITGDISFGSQLERVRLEYCTGIQHLGCLARESNNLSDLTIFFSGELIWRLFESIQKPQLRNLILHGVASSRNEIINLEKLVGSMSRIKFLSLDSLFLESLEQGAAVLKRHITTLKKLWLHGIEFDNLVHSQYVICLVKSSPNLQHLFIQLEAEVNSSNVDLMLLWVDIIFDQLKTVRIKGRVGSRAEFQFIKLLLASAPSLKWIKLEDESIYDPVEELRISRELLQLPRASTAAHITWT